MYITVCAYVVVWHMYKVAISYVHAAGHLGLIVVAAARHRISHLPLARALPLPLYAYFIKIAMTLVASLISILSSIRAASFNAKSYQHYYVVVDLLVVLPHDYS